MPLGIHAHNDCEMAVANSLVAIETALCRCRGRLTGSVSGAETPTLFDYS